MGKFIVEGGHRLQGSFQPAGNKNEALPALAASLLTDSTTKLSNMPQIDDLLSMRSILEQLGVSIVFQQHGDFKINPSEIFDQALDPDLCSQIRGSILLSAPLLHRFGKVNMPLPGGDLIGRRRLDTHFLALSKMGAKCTFKPPFFQMQCSQLIGADIFLDEASVTATENLIMAAVLAKGHTQIFNAACEPHVQGLCNMLTAMGAKITGIGSNRLHIEGVKKLDGCEHRIQPDHTEIASMIGLAAVTNSKLTILGGATADMGLIKLFFQRLGVRYETKGKDFIVPREQEMKIQTEADNSITKIDDAPWPGFPADLVSILTVVATQCTGTVLIFEKLFESRLFWVDKLIRMGGNIVLCDPHRALVSGKSELHGSKISSPDIRAGMALLIAALCANGTSEISNIEQIDRGYQHIDKRLQQLGANIQRV